MAAFKSRSQQRYFYARGQKDPRFRYWAAKKNLESNLRGGYASLPWRTRGPHISTLHKLF